MKAREQLALWNQHAADWSLESGHIRNDLEDACDLCERLLDQIEKALTNLNLSSYENNFQRAARKNLERALKGLEK